MEPFSPRSLGQQKSISLTGTVFPWDPERDQPLFLRMSASPAYYIACFSDVEALRALMMHLQIDGYTIKKVDDGAEFLSGLPAMLNKGEPLHVILDPYMTEQNTVRFKQVVGAS